MPRAKPDASWLDKASRVLAAIGDIYEVQEARVSIGPISAVRSLNVSWGASLYYISLAVPDDGVPIGDYQAALEKVVYGS